MNLTFNECVRLIWIYFGIRTGFIVVRVILQTISRVLNRTTTEVETQYMEEKEIYNPCAIIETEQTNSGTEKRRVIGFVSNKMEGT